MREAEHLAPGRVRPVVQVRPQPNLVVRRLVEPERLYEEERPDDERRDQDAVVEREDPQRAPDVEIEEVTAGISRVEQGARDEVARGHEEQLDADPASLADDREYLHAESARDAVRLRDQEHVDEDEQDRDAAQAV